MIVQISPVNSSRTVCPLLNSRVICNSASFSKFIIKPLKLFRVDRAIALHIAHNRINVSGPPRRPYRHPIILFRIVRVRHIAFAIQRRESVKEFPLRHFHPPSITFRQQVYLCAVPLSSPISIRTYITPHHKIVIRPARPRSHRARLIRPPPPLQAIGRRPFSPYPGPTLADHALLSQCVFSNMHTFRTSQKIACGRRNICILYVR